MERGFCSWKDKYKQMAAANSLQSYDNLCIYLLHRKVIGKQVFPPRFFVWKTFDIY